MIPENESDVTSQTIGAMSADSLFSELRQEEVKAATDNPQYNRVKGADWFNSLYKRSVIVIGAGGIGSWLSVLLSRIGCILYIYDMDKYEYHNMSGQLMRQSDLGKNKADALYNLIREVSPDCTISPFPLAYDADNEISDDIMICALDNMEGRKRAFTNWKTLVNSSSNRMRNKMFFQDGRLLAEQLQIISIPGDRPDLMDIYEKEYLFSDAEVPDLDCTFKQTSHCAAMIASHMVGFLTNWASNVKAGEVFKQVPFYYQYLIPLNLATNVNTPLSTTPE